MKYIRTKGGIIEKERVRFLENGQAELTDGKHSWRLDAFPIIKQADTIKELCDKFYLVVYDALAKKKVRISFENCNSAKTHCDRYLKNFDWSIYGAIWTDKGLIYVAKMNNEGVLELL